MKTLLWVFLAGFVFGPASASEPLTEDRGRWLDPVSGISFVALPKGCFTMGRKDGIAPPYSDYWNNISYKNPINTDEAPEHEVCVDAFWMAQHEVTQGQWAKVMGQDSKIKQSSKAANRAKGGVGYGEAQAFARRLTELAGGQMVFRVPTEAEWEYACRAGSKDTALQPEALSKQAWYGVDDIDKAKPRVVGQLAANAFGLYDMLGNIWEWTSDHYQADAYLRHGLYNPRVDMPGAGIAKVIRGGSVRTEHVLVRCAKRGFQPADQPLPLIGLRLVRER